MSKNYWTAAFRYWFSCALKYRSDLFFSFFSELAIPIAVNIVFIIGLSRSSSVKSIANVISYLIVANITYIISVTNLENVISEDIKSSRLIYKLLEPISPFVSYVISDMATKILRVLIFYLPAIILLIFFKQAVWGRILPAIPFILIANIIGYAVSFIIGCLSFWLTEIWGISSIKNLLLGVFAGTIFPFYLLPDTLQRFLFMTPFPFLSYIPSAMVLGELKTDRVYFLLAVGIFWGVVLLLFAKWIWSIGRKKYESVGV